MILTTGRHTGSSITPRIVTICCPMSGIRVSWPGPYIGVNRDSLSMNPFSGMNILPRKATATVQKEVIPVAASPRTSKATARPNKVKGIEHTQHSRKDHNQRNPSTRALVMAPVANTTASGTKATVSIASTFEKTYFNGVIGVSAS